MGLHGEAFWTGITPAEFFAILSERARRNREREERRRKTDGEITEEDREDMIDAFEEMQAEMMARGMGEG